MSQTHLSYEQIATPVEKQNDIRKDLDAVSDVVVSNNQSDTLSSSVSRFNRHENTVTEKRKGQDVSSHDNTNVVSETYSQCATSLVCSDCKKKFCSSLGLKLHISRAHPHLETETLDNTKNDNQEKTL